MPRAALFYGRSARPPGRSVTRIRAIAGGGGAWLATPARASDDPPPLLVCAGRFSNAAGKVFENKIPSGFLGGVSTGPKVENPFGQNKPGGSASSRLVASAMGRYCDSAVTGSLQQPNEWLAKLSLNIDDHDVCDIVLTFASKVGSEKSAAGSSVPSARSQTIP